MKIAYASTVEEARAFVKRGYTPIECSFGEESVVDRWGLDHHGFLEEEDPVSLKAFKHTSQRGYRALSRFVFTGQPDPDAVVAALLMAKEISPSKTLVEAVAQLDRDPVGIDQTRPPFIHVSAFRMDITPDRTQKSYEKALKIGKAVFGTDSLDDSTIRAARSYERLRKEKAANALQICQNGVAFAISDVDNRDFWHGLRGEGKDIVVQYKPLQGVITFSGCSPEAVQRLQQQNVSRIPLTDLLGERGFHSFYIDSGLEFLLGKGSGGRTHIGGSPRHQRYSEDIARKTWQLLCAVVRNNKKPTTRLSA